MEEQDPSKVKVVGSSPTGVTMAQHVLSPSNLITPYGYKIAIIGSGGHKFSDYGAQQAQDVIAGIIEEESRKLTEDEDGALRFILSGGCKDGGVDAWAVDIASWYDMDTIIIKPDYEGWDDNGGYKERNRSIAQRSQYIHVVVPKTDRSGGLGSRGSPTGPCYHCAKRPDGIRDCRQPPLHMKSGACWTAWWGIEAGWVNSNNVHFHLIDQNPPF